MQIPYFIYKFNKEMTFKNKKKNVILYNAIYLFICILGLIVGARDPYFFKFSYF